MSYDDSWEASVGKHGDLEEVAPGLYWVWAPTPGVPVTRNMSIYVLPEGELLVHSPICLDEERMKKLGTLGNVRFLLVPNLGHRLDIKRWKKRFPNALVVAPKNARVHVEDVIPVEQTCEEALPPLGVRIHRPGGMKEGYELVYEVDLRGGGKGLIINDVLAAPHPHPPTGFGGFVSGLLGLPGGKIGQPRIVRFRFREDRAKFRQFVERLARIEDLRAILTSHGGPVTDDPAGQLRDALTRL